MCRKRGRIVLMDNWTRIVRADFYEKSLAFRSPALRPGRYDSITGKDHDYPIGRAVDRQRNFEAVLDTLAEGTDVSCKPSLKLRRPKTCSSLEGARGSRVSVSQATPSGTTPSSAINTAPAPQKVEDPGWDSWGLVLRYTRWFGFQEAGAQLVQRQLAASVVLMPQGFGFAETTTDTAVISDPGSVPWSSPPQQPCRPSSTGARSKTRLRRKTALSDFGRIARNQKSLWSGCPSSPDRGLQPAFAPHIVKMKELIRRISAPKAFV